MIIEFEVDGAPFGKERGRARSFVGKDNKLKTRVYGQERTAAYEKRVAEAYKAAAGGFRFDDDAPLMVIITAYYPIPTSDSKKKKALKLEGRILPTKRPDWDNIGKVVCDGLQRDGAAMKDDSRIAYGSVGKFYSDRPRVHVIIKEYQA